MIRKTKKKSLKNSKHIPNWQKKLHKQKYSKTALTKTAYDKNIPRDRCFQPVPKFAYSSQKTM